MVGHASARLLTDLADKTGLTTGFVHALGVDDLFVTTDVNTLLTALYVKIDDWLGQPPADRRPPKLYDAELITLAVAQALLGIRSEARWPRFLPRHLPGAFPYLPGQSGYNKRMRALGRQVGRAARDDADAQVDVAGRIDAAGRLLTQFPRLGEPGRGWGLNRVLDGAVVTVPGQVDAARPLPP